MIFLAELAFKSDRLLGKVKALGNVEIIDGSEEDAAEEESA